MSESEKVTELGPLHYARKDRATGAQPSTIDKSVFGGDVELENRTLRARIADLDGQIKILQSSRLIAPHEEAAIAEKSRAFDAANNELNRIAKYLRDAFPQALGTGPTLSAIVIGLLDELRAARKPGLWARVFGR